MSDLRRSILDEALRLMAARGYHATSMRELARACRCNVAILYRHFPSKEAILAAVVEERRHRILHGPPPVRRARNDEETLVRLLRVLIERDPEYDRLYRIVLSERLHGGRLLAGLTEELLTGIERAYRRWLLDLFPRLRGSAELGAIARLLRSLVHGVYVEHLETPPAERRAAIARRARELARLLARAGLFSATGGRGAGAP